MLKKCFDNVREKHPLVHNITNYVTVNDVANILLTCGGSPIMADDSEEVEDITSICQGLNINIGTLNKNTIPSMFQPERRQMHLAMLYCLTRQEPERADLEQKQRMNWFEILSLLLSVEIFQKSEP